MPSLECQRTWDEWQNRTQFWEDAEFKSFQSLQRRKGTYQRAPQFGRTNFHQFFYDKNQVIKSFMNGKQTNYYHAHYITIH